MMMMVFDNDLVINLQEKQTAGLMDEEEERRGYNLLRLFY